MARQVVVVGKFVTRRRRMRESAVDFCPPSPMSTTTSVLLQGTTSAHTHTHTTRYGARRTLTFLTVPDNNACLEGVQTPRYESETRLVKEEAPAVGLSGNEEELARVGWTGFGGGGEALVSQMALRRQMSQ